MEEDEIQSIDPYNRDNAVEPTPQPMQVAQNIEQPGLAGNVMPRIDTSRQDSIEETKKQIAEKYPQQQQVAQPVQEQQQPVAKVEPPKQYNIYDYANALWHENDMYVVYDTLRDQYNNGAIDHTPDPNFNPVSAAQGTWAEGKLDKLVHLQNQAEFDNFISEGQEHIDNDKIIDSLGWMGYPLRFVNGMASPAIVIPGMMGPKAWGVAARMAAAGAASAAITEPWYRANDPTRTNEDSLIAISAASVGSALLGKGAVYAFEKAAPVIERVRQARGEAPPVTGRDKNNFVVNPKEDEFTAYTADNYYGPEAPAVTKEMVINGERIISDGENIAPPVRGEMNGVEGGIETAPANSIPAPKTEALPDEKLTPEQQRERVLQGRESEFGRLGPETLYPITDKAGQIISGLARTSGGQIVADVVTPLGRTAHIVGTSIASNIMSNSPSAVSRATLLDMCDTAIRPANQKLGELRTLGGGAIETERNATVDTTIFDMMRVVDEHYSEHRFGSADKEPLRITGSNWWGFSRLPEGKSPYDEFQTKIFEALNNGDEALDGDPLVTKAAKQIRPYLQTWEDRAGNAVMNDGTKLLGDNLGAPKGAKSWIGHTFSKAKIDAAPDKFREMFYKGLKDQHNSQVSSREKIKLYHGALESSDEYIETLNKIIDGGQEKLDKLAIQQEEVRRFNKFAYGRSEKMTGDTKTATGLDTARAAVRAATDKIAPQLERLEALRTQISAERDNLPHIKQMENALFNLINANGRVKNSKSAFEQIAGAEDLVNALDEVIGNTKGGIKYTGEDLKLAASMPDAATLKSLRAEQAKIKKAIRPYTDVIAKNRKAINGWMETRGPLAKGGAVFETEIRNRGNTLADRETAHISTVEEAKTRLAAEIEHNNNMRDKLETEIQGWAGKSGDDAKSALAARAEAEAERSAKIEEGSYKGRAERLTSADKATRSFARRVIERTDLDKTGDDLEKYLREQAENIAEDIRFNSNTRRLYNDPPKNSEGFFANDEELRGSFKGRTIPLDFQDKMPFLETDLRQVFSKWGNTVPVDVMFAEKMGSLDLKDRFALIDNDYKNLRLELERKLENKEISQREYNRLFKEYEEQQKIDKTNLQTSAARIRGTYGTEFDGTTQAVAEFARDMKNVATVASLGRATLTSVVDAGAAQAMRWGLGEVLSKQYFPLVKALANGKLIEFAGPSGELRKQARDFGVSIDTSLSLMRYKIPDIYQGPGNSFSKGLAYTTSRFMVANLLLPWTDLVKTISIGGAQRVFGEAAIRIANGKASKRDLTRMFDANIPENIAAEIGRQYQKHAGDNIGIGYKFANIDRWDMTPEAQEAKRYFMLGLNREANTVVMTPMVASSPHFTNQPLLNPLFQFKSFAWRAHEIMATSNWQNMDTAMVGGYVTAGTLATIGLYYQKLARGEEFPDDPMQVLKEVTDLASIAPIYTELNKLASGVTSNQIDAWRLAGVESPYMRSGDQSQLQSLLGPSYGMGANALAVGFDAASGNLNGNDIHKTMKMLPGYNHPLAWPFYKRLEAGVVDYSGVKPTKKQKEIMEDLGY